LRKELELFFVEAARPLHRDNVPEWQIVSHTSIGVPSSLFIGVDTNDASYSKIANLPAASTRCSIDNPITDGLLSLR